MGDLIVSDVSMGWDESVEELVSNLSNYVCKQGDEGNIFENFERKVEIAPTYFFSHWWTDWSDEHPPPPTTTFFLCTPLYHRSQMGLFGEQNKPEEPVTFKLT